MLHAALRVWHGWMLCGCKTRNYCSLATISWGLWNCVSDMAGRSCGHKTRKNDCSLATSSHCLRHCMSDMAGRSCGHKTRKNDWKEWVAEGARLLSSWVSTSHELQGATTWWITFKSNFFHGIGALNTIHQITSANLAHSSGHITAIILYIYHALINALSVQVNIQSSSRTVPSRSHGVTNKNLSHVLQALQGEQLSPLGSQQSRPWFLHPQYPTVGNWARMKEQNKCPKEHWSWSTMLECSNTQSSWSTMLECSNTHIQVTRKFRYEGEKIRNKNEC